MTAAIPKVGRAVLLGLAAVLAACSDVSAPLVPTPDVPPQMLVLGGSETLSSGMNLTNGSSASWNVTIPSSGTIRLSFDGRINWSSTAGNSTILELKVNGTPVTASLLHNKSASYTYPNRSQTESYYANRGSAWGQSTSYWGLFWSPNFADNHSSSNNYYVPGSKAYSYEFTIDGLVNYGQVNTIEMVNRGAWVQTATGTSPTIVLQNVKVQSITPPIYLSISASSQAQPYQVCSAFPVISGGTPPFSYQWYVDFTPYSNNYQLSYTNWGSHYRLDLYVTDAANATANATHYVSVSPYASSC